MGRDRRRAAYRVLWIWSLLVAAGFLFRHYGREPRNSVTEQNARLLQERLLLEEDIDTLEQRRDLLGKLEDRLQGFSPLPARVLSRPLRRDISARRSSLLLDVGETDGVRIGLGVIADTGVIGVVAEVGPRRCRVRLADDSSFRILFLLDGTRALGLAAGGPRRGELHPFLLRDTIAFREGQVLVTAGDEQFPAGILIGKVQTVAHPIQRTRIALFHDLDRLGIAVVLLPPVLESPSRKERP